MHKRQQLVMFTGFDVWHECEFIVVGTEMTSRRRQNTHEQGIPQKLRASLSETHQCAAYQRVATCKCYL